MARRAGNVVDQLQRPIEGASLFIYALNPDGTVGNLASLTTDAGAPITQPVVTGRSGEYAVNGAEGIYHTQYFYAGKLFRTDEVFTIGGPLSIFSDVINATDADRAAAEAARVAAVAAKEAAESALEDTTEAKEAAQAVLVDPNFLTVLGIASDIEAVADIAPNVTAVANLSGDIETVVDIAPAIASVASNSVSVSYVADNGPTILTAATDAANAAATVGFPAIPGEAHQHVIVGGTATTGERNPLLWADLRTGEVCGWNVSATTALGLVNSTPALGTNWSARSVRNAAGKFQIRAEHRQSGAIGLVTTTGNNVDPVFEGDNVRWVNTDAVGAEPAFLYAPASGLPLITGGTIKAALPRNRYFCLGDSLTFGSGSTLVGGNLLDPEAGSNVGSFPSRLLHLHGGPNYRKIWNDGFSGHTSQHMLSRLNSDDHPININVTGASVPSTGTVAVTLISPYPTISTGYPAGQGPMAARTSVMTGLAVIGGVRHPVTLRSTLSGGNTTYTLEKTTPGGSAVSWPNGTRFYRDLTDKDDRIIIWWAGRNFENVSQINTDDGRLENCIRSLSKRLLAITVPIRRDGTEDTGQPNRVNQIDPMNANKAARWASIANGGPLIDINAFFQRLAPFGNGSGAPTVASRGGTLAGGGYSFAGGVSFPGFITNSDGTVTFPDAFALMGLSPTAQDLTDIAAGRNPDTMMGTDNLHISDEGYEALARLIFLIEMQKGWSL
jgi:hypothetical protein